MAISLLIGGKAVDEIVGRSTRSTGDGQSMPVSDAPSRRATQLVRGPVASYAGKKKQRDRAVYEPTIANWGDAKLSDYAVGCIVKMNAPEAHLSDWVCGSARRTRLCDRQSPTRSTRSCSTNTRAASFIRATLHRYSTFEDVCRATDGYGERVERPEDLPLPSSAPLKGCREKRHALLNVICRVWRRNELARGFCSSLRCASGIPMQTDAIRQICFLASPYGATHVH